MNLLTIENLTHSFSERKLFENASFYLDEGEKVGIPARLLWGRAGL